MACSWSSCNPYKGSPFCSSSPSSYPTEKHISSQSLWYPVFWFLLWPDNTTPKIYITYILSHLPPYKRSPILARPCHSHQLLVPWWRAALLSCASQSHLSTQNFSPQSPQNFSPQSTQNFSPKLGLLAGAALPSHTIRTMQACTVPIFKCFTTFLTKFNPSQFYFIWSWIILNSNHHHHHQGGYYQPFHSKMLVIGAFGIWALHSIFKQIL